jgi:hypothetical protein
MDTIGARVVVYTRGGGLLCASGELAEMRHGAIVLKGARCTVRECGEPIEAATLIIETHNIASVLLVEGTQA